MTDKQKRLALSIQIFCNRGYDIPFNEQTVKMLCAQEHLEIKDIEFHPNNWAVMLTYPDNFTQLVVY